MDTELSLSEVIDLTGLVPRSAGVFLSDYLKRKGLSENQAAKFVGCSASTIHRLIKGGKLTVNMAAKLNHSFGLSVQMLFAIDTASKAYWAEKRVEHLKFV